MRLLLISAPTVMSYKAKVTSTQYPINLGGIASFLKKNGHEVRLIDFNVDSFSKEKFHRSISVWMPDAIGISSMTPAIKYAGIIATGAKESFPDIPVLIGGVHCSAIPKQTLKEFPQFDIVVMGEGEETILEVMERLSGKEKLSGIKGTAWRKGKQVMVEERRPLIHDLDSLPFPDRTLVSMKKYENSHASRGFSRKFLNIAEIMTSRGCPNQCIFCAGHINYGFKVRFRSIDNIMAEIVECKEKLGVNHVSVEDDTFTLNKKLVFEFCERIKKLGITWNCNTRVNTVSPEMLKAMVGSGCLKISFGVESGSQRMLDLMKKGITVEQVRQAFSWAREAGLKYGEGTFMIGAHPDETMEDVRMTAGLMKEISPDFLSVAILNPYPGTEVYDIMRSKGYIEHFDWEKFIIYGSVPPWRTKNFTSQELFELQKKLLKDYYLRPRTMLRILSKIRSYNEFMYWLEIGMGFLRG